MGVKLHLFIILTIIFMCEGHVPIIGDILSGADSVLGGLTHGLNFNIGGQLGIGKKPQPPPPPKEETVVVIVEGQDNQKHPPNNFRPNDFGQNQNHFRPPYNDNNGYNPGPNKDRAPYQGYDRPNNQYGNEYGHHHNGNRPYGHGRPDNNNYGHHPNHDHRPSKYPNRPDQDYYDRPNNPTHGNDNNQYHDQNQGNNNYYDYNNRPNQGNNFYDKPNRPQQGNNNFNKPIRPNQGFNHDQQNNQGNYNNYDNDNRDDNDSSRPNYGGQIFNKPTTDFSTRVPSTSNKPDKITQQPIEDVPLFIPLNPNETNTGDDKTNTDPKRETVKKDDDEDFDIDVRIKEN